MYKVKKFTHPNGERMAVLIDVSTGLPLYYQNLYVTLLCRNAHKAENTIYSTLNNLGLLAEICDYLKIDLESRFKSGEWLRHFEIELLVQWLKRKKSDLEKAESVSADSKSKVVIFRTVESARHKVLKSNESVDLDTAYLRMTDVSKYLSWLSNALKPDLESEKMINYFMELRNSKKSSSTGDPDKALTMEQLEKVLETVAPAAPNNPWKDESVRYRNQLIVNLLADLGCRRGELLNLKVDQLTNSDVGMAVEIRRDANNPDDPRKYQPCVKTLGRDVLISMALVQMYEDYVIKYRSKVKGANKCAYLFISHHKDRTTTRPLSLSAIDKIFSEISCVVGFNVHPHRLRHTWNEEFIEEASKLLESGEMTLQEVEDT